MSDFCKQCTEDLFGPGHPNDMKGLTTQKDWDKGLARIVICEGCGVIQVDPEGRCVTKNCFKCHGEVMS